MSWPLIIAIAGPVRGKGAGRAAVAGVHARVYQDAKTRSYEAQIRFAAQQAMAGEPPTAEPVKVRIEARLPIPRSGWSKRKRDEAVNGIIRPTVKPDANNISKVLDSLNGVVWVDDKQIVEEVVVKYYAETPGLLVRVTPLRLAEGLLP